MGLERIGDVGMVLLLAAGGALWALLLLALLSRRAPRVRRDALTRVWERFLAVLRRRGVEVMDHDGPVAIRQRAQRQLPEAAGDIDLFAADYMRLRFGGGDPDDMQGLAKLKARLAEISRATRSRRRRQTATADRE
jgi:hypothetical protein